MGNKGEIIIYSDKSSKTDIEVTLDGDTVWLSQAQMADLFKTDRTVITRHINNIFAENELDPVVTSAKFAQVQNEGDRRVTRKIAYYNLDVIISVGYRVNSKRGTQFRIWATNTLRNYLIKGYAINARRLKQQSQSLIELQSNIKLLQQVAVNYPLNSEEAKGLIEVINLYSQSLEIIDAYDRTRAE